MQEANLAGEREKLSTSQRIYEMKKTLVSNIELIEKSDVPNRRSEGLALIREIVDPEPDQRSKLRDLAMKFLVLREVEAHHPELPTGRSHGLAFGPNWRRLAVLSEDNEELALWDVERRQRVATLSLRADAGTLGAQAMRQTLEPGMVDPGVDRLEPGPGPLPAAAFSAVEIGVRAHPVTAATPVIRPSSGSSRPVPGRPHA